MEREETSLGSLVRKIRRLRRRLTAYGWNRQEATRFVLYQFLKLPEPEWEKPSTTVSFYQIRDKFKVDSPHAEIILSLQQIIPNLHEEDVLHYLHSVFQYSSLSFGFDLFDSSSDSGENPLIMRRMPKAERPLRYKPTVREVEPNLRKKQHRYDQNIENNQEEKWEAKPEEIRLVRRRKVHKYPQHDNWEKSLKKQDFD